MWDEGIPKIPLAVMLISALLGSTLVLLPAPALASVGCGATITTNTVLTSNIGPCSGNGLVIGHNGITLNCNGHTVTGTSTNTHVGIYLNGKTGVTVKNCHFTAFRYGVELLGSSYDTFTANTANSNHYDGFYLYASSHNTLGTNVVLTGNAADSNAQYGFVMYGASNSNTLTSNVANSNNYGFYVSGSSSNALAANTAASNTVGGLYLSGSSGNTVKGNLASKNYYGFQLSSNSRDNTINGNTAETNTGYGYYDSSVGAGTAGTANVYTGDVSNGNGFGGSSPSGLGSVQPNWTTYHGDNARTSYEPVPSFNSVTHAWTSRTLDGAVYAEPLVYGNAVLVATEGNSVYSLNAQTGAVLWHTNLGAPVPGGELQCGDISPSGITGTPVIDASTGTVFVVAFSHLHHFLYGLDASNGVILSNRSADPPGFVDTAQQQRSALSLANGMVYIPYGGLDGDCGPYHGWVVSLPVSGGGKMDVYKVPTAREGGIWATSGAAVYSSGTLYVATGNGASATTFDHGDSVIELSASLSEKGLFAPANWVQLNQDDTDLGSVGPSIVGPSTLFQIGKEGVGYLLNANKLGGIGGQAFAKSVCSASFGGTAYAPPLLYVPCTNGLFALRLGASSFSTDWQTSSFFAGPPMVTGGVVWSIDISSSTLYGFSATSGAQLYSFPLGGVVHFCTPSAGDGHLFVAAHDQVVAFLLGSG
jgi:parallel beta-helix repeat protein